MGKVGGAWRHCRRQRKKRQKAFYLTEHGFFVGRAFRPTNLLARSLGKGLNPVEPSVDISKLLVVYEESITHSLWIK
ncbi:hypothetical protein [Marinomonas sp. 2405UD68-3]|uniref:hypothetical protein n=1 Tax=Marinomonas sp. 2405UD68-3 TaxID=3391835 RepID=UPI0039C98ED9